ncbi:hypothetical protein [Chlorobium ferrooxidans]|uniref:Uncharacterized protein n=1 Tax=Chlorobium ferrooxidans DSM 13031 TaxID=377431 RepID=Q0YPM6_9CHLB|nr:hypothetical protein [Chlorobium ferrooxidans]EAT58264.1 conserved hypothetical protein [Chlorobium ferrooxidans DSM 13031]
MLNPATTMQPWEQGGLQARDAFIAEFLAISSEQFITQEGGFVKGDPIQAYNQGAIPDCNGNNAGHNYMVYALPAPKEQGAINTISAADDNDPKTFGLWTSYRLRQDEVIVFIGQTPPKVDYYSYRSFLYNRFYKEKCKRCILFVSLGDTINNMRIKLSSPAPGSPVIIITGANEASCRLVVKDLIKSISKANPFNDPATLEKSINFDRIPLDLVRMGLKIQDDEFFYLNRVGNFVNESEGDDYLKNENGKYGRVFRLTPIKQWEPKAFVGAENLIPRGSGKNLEFQYSNALIELRSQILKRHFDKIARDIETKVWLFDSFDALQRGIDLLGESRDTSYLETDPFLLANCGDAGDFAIVYGLNHASCGTSTYSNFGVYDCSTEAGVVGKSSSHKSYSGLAAEYLNGTAFAHLAHLFYVWKIGRFEPANQNHGYLQVPFVVRNNGVFSERAEIIPLEQEMKFGFRAYLDPRTGIGPAWWEMLYDRAIVFKSSR